MTENACILVVDDEQPIAEAIAYNLKKEGFTPKIALDAEKCLDIVKNESPSLIILDVMLPLINGFELCKILRQRSDIPIIMLTARTSTSDKIQGLELGADDYVTKPFNMRELVARVRNVLRRTAPGEQDEQAQLQMGNLIIDLARHEVTINNQPVTLSPKEFDLLTFLANHPGRVFTREILLDRVWGSEAFVEERTVDVHIRWLREKIEENASRPRRLITVRGVGYKFSG